MNEQQQLQSAGAGDVTLKQLQFRCEQLTKERDIAQDEARRLADALAESEGEACRLEQRCIALEKVANKAEANAKEERARRHEAEVERDTCAAKACEEADRYDALHTELHGQLAAIRAALGVGEDADLVEAVNKWARDADVAEEKCGQVVGQLRGANSQLVEERDQLRARLADALEGARVSVEELRDARARLAECERERDEAREDCDAANKSMRNFAASADAAEDQLRDIAARVERALMWLDEASDYHDAGCLRDCIRSALAALTGEANAAPAEAPKAEPPTKRGGK